MYRDVWHFKHHVYIACGKVLNLFFEVPLTRGQNLTGCPFQSEHIVTVHSFSRFRDRVIAELCMGSRVRGIPGCRLLRI